MALRIEYQRSFLEAKTVDSGIMSGSLDVRLFDTGLCGKFRFFMVQLAINSELVRTRGIRLFN